MDQCDAIANVYSTRLACAVTAAGRFRGSVRLVFRGAAVKSEATGQARKEAQRINKPLSALADVIAARAGTAV